MRKLRHLRHQHGWNTGNDFRKMRATFPHTWSSRSGSGTTCFGNDLTRTVSNTPADLSRSREMGLDRSHCYS
jgi:hypothetical protein